MKNEEKVTEHQQQAQLETTSKESINFEFLISFLRLKKVCQ